MSVRTESRKPKDLQDNPFSFPESATYRGVVKHIVDGDTLDVFVDLGLFHYAYVTIRLRGIDTPEIYGKNATAHAPFGHQAREYAESLVLDKPVMITTYRDRQSFGRFVGDIGFMDDDGNLKSLASELREAGYDWTNLNRG